MCPSHGSDYQGGLFNKQERVWVNHYPVPCLLFDFYSSYCSECTNTSTGPPEDTLSSLSESERMTEMTPFRFSPTSFISDTLSLPDYEDESHNDSCSLGYLELHDRSASIHSGGHYGGCDEKAHRPSTGDTTILAMSSLSSVSSITLQGDDISLGYDSTSLPEDPFPQGLPGISSASSTIGSPPPSV